jgi:hypothetical protein
MSTKRSRIDWPDHIEKQRRSGIPVKEYCKRAGFSIWSFYANRKRLASPTPISNGDKHLAAAPAAVSFMHVGSLPRHAGMRIFFPDGTRVECDGSLGKESLSYFLAALKGTTVLPEGVWRC